MCDSKTRLCCDSLSVVEEMQQTVEELRQGYAEMRNERNARVAIEDELDLHIGRLDDHERAVAEQFRESEIGFARQLARAQEQMQAAFTQQLDHWKQSVLHPIEDKLTQAATRKEVETQADQAAAMEELLGALQARQEEDHATLGGLFEELQTEHVDHREAIGNMMVLVEKTATLDQVSGRRKSDRSRCFATAVPASCFALVGSRGASLETLCWDH